CLQGGCGEPVLRRGCEGEIVCERPVHRDQLRRWRRCARDYPQALKLRMGFAVVRERLERRVRQQLGRDEGRTHALPLRTCFLVTDQPRQRRNCSGHKLENGWRWKPSVLVALALILHADLLPDGIRRRQRSTASHNLLLVAN